MVKWIFIRIFIWIFTWIFTWHQTFLPLVMKALNWRSLLMIPIVFAEIWYGWWWVSLWSHVQDYQGNAPGMDKEVWRKPESRLEWWGRGLKVWEPLHVLHRDRKHYGWTWLVGSALATTAAAIHFSGRCRGGAPQATLAAHLKNTFFYLIWYKCLEIEASNCWKHKLRSRKGGWWAA